MTRTSIALPEPYDTAWLLGFLRARQVPSVERIGEGGLERAVRIEGRAVVLHVGFEGARRVRIGYEGSADPAAVRRLVSRMLDIGADVTAFRRVACRDRLLRPLLARRPGLRVPQFADPFEGLVRAVIGQQISVRGASTLVDRLVRALTPPAGDALIPFPTPAEVSAAGPDRLRGIGLTRARAAALHAIAVAIAVGRVDFDRLRHGDPEDVQRQLDDLPGVGPWTAAYVRMRALGDRDAFPASDLGVLKAVRAATGTHTLTPADVARLAEAWRPWRAYAAIHFWAAGYA